LYEGILFQKKEKLIVELDKMQKRIEEFIDYGELDMVKQYVDDTKNVQKRIMVRSEFPILETVKNQLDPFIRLFTTVAKWQRNEKK